MKIPRMATTTVSPGRRQPTKPMEAPAGQDGRTGSNKSVELGNDSAAALQPPDAIHIHVAHLAAPQGSHRQGFGKSVRETNPKTEPYRHAVAQACEDYTEVFDDWEPLDGHLELSVVFWMMPPPKADPDRPFPNVAPDLDKLIRSTCDGITRGKLWKDDARVVRIVAEKEHATSVEQTGVDFTVRKLR